MTRHYAQNLTIESAKQEIEVIDKKILEAAIAGRTSIDVDSLSPGTCMSLRYNEFTVTSLKTPSKIMHRISWE